MSKNRLCEEREFLFSLVHLSKNKFIRVIESATTNQLHAIVDCIFNYHLFCELNTTERRLIEKFKGLVEKDLHNLRQIISSNLDFVRAILSEIFYQISFTAISEHLCRDGSSYESD